MPTAATAITGCKAIKYEVEPRQAVRETYDVPGFNGDITKTINKKGPQIIERGWVDPTTAALAAIYQHEQDDSQLITLDTLGRGSYTNCYLDQVRLGEASVGNGTRASHVSFERVWVQKIRAVPS